MERMRVSDMLVLHCQRLTTLNARALYLQGMGMGRSKMWRGYMHEAIFTNNPVKSYLRLPLVRYIVTLMSLGFAIFGVNIAVQSRGIPRYRYYRFTNLESRDAIHLGQPSSPGIQRFGLLRDWGVSGQGQQRQCRPRDEGGWDLASDGAAMVLSLPDGQEAGGGDFGGWYIVTLGGDGTQPQDAVRFKLEGSEDRAFSNPEVVGGSTLITRNNGALSGFAMVAVACSRYFYHGKNFLIAVVLCNAVARLVIGTCILSMDLAFENGKGYFLRDYLMGAAFLCFALILRFAEKYWEWSWVLMGLTQTLSEFLVKRLFMANIEDDSGVSYWTALNGWLPVLLSIMIWAARLRFAVQEFFGIRKDIDVYEEVWARIKSEEHEGVKALAQVVRSLQAETARKVPRQLNKSFHSEPRAKMPRRLSFMQGSGRAGIASSQRGAGAKRRTKRGSSVFSVFSFGGSLKVLPIFHSPSSEQSPSVADESSVRSTNGSFRSTHGGRVAPLDVARPVGFGSDKDTRSNQVQVMRNFLVQNVLQSSKLANFLNWSLDGHHFDLGRPVDSIDQLHAQAFVVQDLFQEFVVSTALKYKGKFKVKRVQGDRFDSGFEAASWDGSKELRSRFELAGLKSVQSATRKCHVVYGGDVSKILDMVRETLYFDTVEELAQCLKGIQRDPLIEVVRVKSTLSKVAPSTSYVGSLGWAGMRFVSVNVKLVGSQEARDLHVDTHVCELLLVLTGIGRVRTDAMAERYQQWRIVRMQGSANLPSWLASVLGLLDVTRSAGAVDPSTRSEEPLQSIAAGRQRDDVEVEACGVDLQSQKRSKEHEECTKGEGEPTQDEEVAGAHGDDVDAHVRPPSLQQDPDPSSPVHEPTSRSTRSRQCSQNGSGRSLANSALGEIQPEGRDSELVMTSWGVPVSADVYEIVKGLCQMSVLGLFDFIDSRWNLVVDYSRVDQANFSAAFFSTNPVTAACHRWQFQLMLFFTGMWYGYLGVQNVMFRDALMGEYSFGPFKHYRLETMLTRDGSQGGAVKGPGISDFGIIGGSRCFSGASARQASFSGPLGSSFLVSHSEGRSITGWYLASGDAVGSEPQDTSFFEVWATNDDLTIGDGSCALARADAMWWESGDVVEWCGAQWEKVGTPFWGYGRNGKPWDFRKIPVELPLMRGDIQDFILPPDWEEFDYFFVYQYFCLSMACLSGCFAGLISSKLPGLLGPHLWLGSFLCLDVLFGLRALIVALQRGQTHMSLEIFFRTAINVILAAVCLAQGPWVVKGLGAYAFLSIGYWLSLSYWFWRSAELPQGGAALLAMLVCLICARTWALWSSKKLLQEDQQRYDSLYAALLRNEESRAGIQHLVKVVQMIGLPPDGDHTFRQYDHMLVRNLPPRQRDGYTRNPAQTPINPLMRELDLVHVPGRVDTSSTVSSINQLYAAAALAHLLVAQRIKVWAERSEGMFLVCSHGDSPTTSSESSKIFRKWNQIKDDPVMEHIPLVPMKRFVRAIEKLLRSYGHDPSRLLDVSRNCIVFATVADLTRALGNIITDENVRVERLKNRLDPKQISDQTSGYRDVCLNLRAVNKEAMSLGVDMHVCEVQLILLDFAKLRTAEGHQRYVQARNQAGV